MVNLVLARRAFALGAIALLACTAFICVVRTVESSAEDAMTAIPRFASPHTYLFQTPAQGEKTVEQVQKNIQVLQGLAQSQLIPVMNFISSSLGVRCNFCHVMKEGNWDFPSDEKPEKNTAREMIKMVQNINKTTFRGQDEVSCWTCHRGSSRPVSLVPLPVEFPAQPGRPAGPGATPAASASPTPANPTADEILAKYQQALGGPSVLDKLRSRSLRGTWTTAQGMEWGYEAIEVAPDKVYMLVKTPRQGNIERGYNGTVGWELSARGLRDLSGPDLIFLRRYPSLFGDVKLKEQFSRLAFGARSRINDRDVYALQGTTVSGKRERLFFDVQTGLLVRRIIYTPTPVGVIPEQVDFEDYRDVDGMKVPFTIRVSTVDPNSTSTRKLTEIKLNVPIEDAKFNKPPAPAPRPSPTP